MKNFLFACCSKIGRILWRPLLLSVVLMNIACSSVYAVSRVPAGKNNGLMLDVARHFYPVDVVKQYIDAVAESGGHFLHLHFSDHENYALESAVLDQLSENAEFSDGVYRNPKTGRPFFRDEQIAELAEYAHAKGVELVPELGSPNHMNAVFELLELSRGGDYVRRLKSRVADDEIDINNEDSVVFVKSLINEVAAKFPYSKRFHIGGDEFGYSVESNAEFVRYANRLSAFLAGKGLKTQMWNDGIIRQTMNDLSRNIEVTYWSFDGNPRDRQAARQRRAIRASMPDLIEAGFDVWNYNSYYLYFVPSQNLASSDDGGFAVRDVKHNWNIGVWDNDDTRNTLSERETAKVKGAALAIWGEHAGKLDALTIYEHTRPLLKAVIQKANQIPVKLNKTDKVPENEK